MATDRAGMAGDFRAGGDGSAAGGRAAGGCGGGGRVQRALYVYF